MVSGLTMLRRASCSVAKPWPLTERTGTCSTLKGWRVTLALALAAFTSLALDPKKMRLAGVSPPCMQCDVAWLGTPGSIGVCSNTHHAGGGCCSRLALSLTWLTSNTHAGQQMRGCMQAEVTGIHRRESTTAGVSLLCMQPAVKLWLQRNVFKPRGHLVGNVAHPHVSTFIDCLSAYVHK